jgi:hypothetical protein
MSEVGFDRASVGCTSTSPTVEESVLTLILNLIFILGAHYREMGG